MAIHLGAGIGDIGQDAGRAEKNIVFDHDPGVDGDVVLDFYVVSDFHAIGNVAVLPENAALPDFGAFHDVRVVPDFRTGADFAAVAHNGGGVREVGFRDGAATARTPGSACIPLSAVRRRPAEPLRFRP